MRVKRYLVDTMPDAMQKIRAELGKDAIIVSTKDVKIGGFLGLFRKKKIEVIAAADSVKEKEMPVTTAASSASFAEAFAAARAQTAVNTSLNSHIPARSEHDSPIIPPVLPKHSYDASPGSEAKMQESVGRHASGRSDEMAGDNIWDELKELKAMLKKLGQAQSADAFAWPEAFRSCRDQLLLHGVSAEHVDDLMEQAKERWEHAGGTDADAEGAVPFIREAILTKLPPQRFEGLSENARIFNFVGPTGVGKTTTIAKLAAEQVLRQNKKVGFITSDTYRISAVEQLRTYANILNVPLEVVFSPQELMKAFKNLEHCDLIFMDTAGRNYRNEMYVSELNSLLSSQGSSETYLVLSLAAKYSDMKLITDNFSKFKLDKVLFTKLDETETYGAILNLACDFPLKLSYVTNGQNVPQDIQRLQSNDILDLLLGVDGHG